MSKDQHPETVSDDELERAEGEQLPDREVMTIINPAQNLPPVAGADGIATISPDEPQPLPPVD